MTSFTPTVRHRLCGISPLYHRWVKLPLSRPTNPNPASYPPARPIIIISVLSELLLILGDVAQYYFEHKSGAAFFLLGIGALPEIMGMLALAETSTGSILGHTKLWTNPFMIPDHREGEEPILSTYQLSGVMLAFIDREGKQVPRRVSRRAAERVGARKSRLYLWAAVVGGAGLFLWSVVYYLFYFHTSYGRGLATVWNLCKGPLVHSLPACKLRPYPQPHA